MIAPARRPSAAGLGCAAALACALVSAPSARAASDVLSQDIAVDLTGDTLHVEVDARVHLDGPLPIYALVAPAVDVEVGGQPATLEDEPQYPGLVQWLTPADGVVPDGGADVDVHLVLDGAPSCASRVQPGLDACTFHGDEVVLLPDEPGAAWYLISLLASDPFSGSVTVHAPAGMFVAAGQGAAVDSAVLDDGSSRSRFDIAVDTELLGVFARDVDTVSTTAGDGKRVVAGVPADAQGGDSHDVMQRVAETGARVLPRYEEMYGPLAVDEIHYLPVSGRYPFGGMGLLGDIFLGDFVTWPQFDFIVEQGAAHELAHSWWGGMTTAANPDEGGFLQEAFAEYSAWRALGVDDDDVRTAGTRMNAVWYMTQIGDADLAILDAANDPDAYVLVTYHKGSTVLRSLEEKVGADVFTAALRALVDRGPGQLTVDALAEEIDDAGGGDVSTFLDQWLRAPGWPTLRAGFDGETLCIDVEGDYDVDVPVRAVAADGTVTEAVLSADAAHAGAAKLGADTVLVEVDPRWTLVRTVAPALAGDVSLDGRVDAVDLMEVALRSGARIPDQRRQDGSYDPLYDVDNSGAVDDADVDTVLAYALGKQP